MLFFTPSFMFLYPALQMSHKSCPLLRGLCVILPRICGHVNGICSFLFAFLSRDTPPAKEAKRERCNSTARAISLV